ncbi:MAG: hypothetical protein LBI54_04600 [Lachnospiraceae bacterium]|jgi:hypothetical protein|nr:hypothetical protein [Lachnospiraceae bacterium]
MTTITQTSENDNALQRKFADFMKRFQMNKILRSVNGAKEKGIPAREVFAALLGLAFTHKNLYRLLSAGSGNLSFGKDVELLSRCYDHSKKRFYNGFTMLNVAWSDGQTQRPRKLPLGSLFFFICDELQDISFAAAIDMLVSLLEQYLSDVARLAEGQVYALAERFIGCLPACIKDKPVYAVCES